MNSGAPGHTTDRAFFVTAIRGPDTSELGSIGAAGEANDLLAAIPELDSDDCWLVFVPATHPDAASAVAELRSILAEKHQPSHRQQVAMVINPALNVEAVGGHRAMATWLRRFASVDLASQVADAVDVTVAVRPAAVLTVGGFDTVSAGLGLADLATRLRRGNWRVDGAPTDPVSLQGLEPQLSARERLRSAADWHRRYGDGDSFHRYQRLVWRAAALEATVGRLKADSQSQATIGQILTDARCGWLRPRPDEEQQGVGLRADWRFLLPNGSARHLLLTGSAAADSGAPGTGELHFLQSDDWAEQVSVHQVPSDATAPEVVVIGLGQPPAGPLAAAAENATVVLELDGGPLGRIRRARALQAAGFTTTAQYLVTPDLARAKRYVSLSDAEAIRWLLSQPPPVPGARRGLSRATVGLGIRTISAAVAKLASIPVISALAGAGAQGLAIATRAQPQRQTVDAASDLPRILMTSGHDEGSRAVLVSLASERLERTVTKMSPRPRYNSNTETEAEVIRSVRTLINRSGSSDASYSSSSSSSVTVSSSGPARADSLLPVIKPPVVLGQLRGSQEAYAGRWTATDLCNRAPDSRQHVLTTVLGAIDELCLATVTEIVPWSAELFDRYLGDLFDRYRAEIGWSSTLEVFSATLTERSDTLAGHSIPLVQRHYDLGPWNVVFDDDGEGLTVIDWELAPPRTIGQAGLGGADQLYFSKYWLHIAMGTESVDDELQAFEFVTGAKQAAAAKGLTESLDRLGIDRRFAPLLAGHLWLEVALYTAARRAENGGDPGSPARYVETLASRRAELLQFWS
ncbi:MAG: hypothetical protein ACRBK7_01105 [Acidimicrobiales bacterium]